MSLKAFHVVFISVSVLLCWGFGLWCLNDPAARERAGYVAGGWVSILVGFGLVGYEVMFVRKFKNKL